MKWLRMWSGILAAVCICYAFGAVQQTCAREAGSVMVNNGRVTIDIVYDNMKVMNELDSAWGFGCVIQGLEKTILFDTGGDGEILLSNLNRLAIDPQSVGMVIISHSHGDHAGGLEAFLAVNPNVAVFVPVNFPNDALARIEKKSSEAITVGKPLKIGRNAWLSGSLGVSIPEQSLIIDSDSGAVVICGCSHPGITEIVDRAQALTGKGVHMIIGGLHLRDKSNGEIEEIVEHLQRSGVRRVAPSHCTGEKALRIFREKFGANMIESGAGKRIEVFGVE